MGRLIMKLELNFLPDKPTLNGRIYEKDTLIEAFKDKVDIPVTSFPSKGIAVNLKDIIGFANLSELSYEKIEFDIKPINQSMLDVVKKLTISGIGEVERVDVKNDQGLITESKKVVKDLKINYLFAAIS